VRSENKVHFDWLLSWQHFCQKLLQSSRVCKDYSKWKVGRFLRYSLYAYSTINEGQNRGRQEWTYLLSIVLRLSKRLLPTFINVFIVYKNAFITVFWLGGCGRYEWLLLFTALPFRQFKIPCWLSPIHFQGRSQKSFWVGIMFYCTILQSHILAAWRRRLQLVHKIIFRDWFWEGINTDIPPVATPLFTSHHFTPLDSSRLDSFDASASAVWIRR